MSIVPVLKPFRTDWVAQISCYLATCILLGLVWFVVDPGQVYALSDDLRSFAGVDLLFLMALILLIGTPTALLLGCIGLYRTREKSGRKGRWLAVIGCIISLIIIGLVAWFIISFEIAWSHFHLTM